jgi:hypothetical protein
MIKELVLLTATTINTSNHSGATGPIVNFDTGPALPSYQSIIDAIPYSDHIVIETPDSSLKTGWGINSGAVSYQWTTEYNIHFTVGLNLGIDSNNQFGEGPVFGMKYKF